MSWQAARAVRDLRGIDPTAKLVLVMIALRAGDDGRAWPSVATVVEDTGLSDRGVRLAVKRLRKTGHLVVVHSRGEGWTMTVSAAPRAGPPRHDVPDTAAPGAKKRGTSYRGKRKGREQEVATPGSSAKRPAVADNGNGPAPVHNLAWVELLDGTVKRP
jgi:hypothetical protein